MLPADVADPRTGYPHARAGTLLSSALAHQVAATGITAVPVRSPLTCVAARGICQQCYGRATTTGDLVALGTVIGVIAAQSVGEPGTQLTLRTVHVGGVAHGQDIVASLPRVEELVEARRPRGAAPLAPHDGTVRLRSEERRVGKECRL